MTDTVAAVSCPSRFQLAGCRIDVPAHRIERQGESLHLEPRVMQLLVFLAERQGQVVSRIEIEDRVWTGTVVGYDALTQSVAKLRRALGDSPRQPRIIETVAKSGYRLIAPVEPWVWPVVTGANPVTVEDPPAGEAGPGSAVDRLRLRRLPMIAALSLVLLVVLGLLLWPATKPAPAMERSIAILPFENLSGDPAQNHLAASLTYELITNLSRFPLLRVASRSSAAATQDRSASARELAQALNVRYLLEGGIRRQGDQVRIVAQLVDAEADRNAWTRRFDEQGSDPFELQDRMVEKIAASIGGIKGILQEAEQRRAWSKDSLTLDEYDYYARGHTYFFRFTREDNERAKAIWTEGLQRFPDSTLLLTKLGWAYQKDYTENYTADRPGALQRLEAGARRAMADENAPLLTHWYALWQMAFVHLYRREYDQALDLRRQALDLVPYDPHSLSHLAEVQLYAGVPPDEVMPAIEQAIQLRSRAEPNDLMRLGWVHYLKGDYQRAVANLEQVTKDWQLRLRLLAAAYGQLGQQQQARQNLDKARQLDPDLSLARLRELLPYRHQADLEHELEGLRKAGLQ